MLKPSGPLPGAISTNPDEIIREYLPQVKKLARRVYDRYGRWHPFVNHDDLTQVGLLKLVDKATRYEPGPAQFWTYAYAGVRGAMIDELENYEAASTQEDFTEWVSQYENTKPCVESGYSHQIVKIVADNAYTEVELKQAQRILLEGLKALDYRKRLILESYLADERPDTLRIAKMYGVSSSAISIEALRAFNTLIRSLRRYSLNRFGSIDWRSL